MVLDLSPSTLGLPLASSVQLWEELPRPSLSYSTKSLAGEGVLQSWLPLSWPVTIYSPDRSAVSIQTSLSSNTQAAWLSVPASSGASH